MRGNKILIINGPNINCLDHRENIYPNQYSYQQLMDKVNEFDQNIIWFQANSEGRIIDAIQSVIYNEEVGGLIINPGGYTHYSISILDALNLLDLTKVEVHMTYITKREDFRSKSITALGVDQVYMGQGIDSYIDGIKYIRSINNKKEDENC